jgi:phospholipid/cholesterol/gamma-HCH transport system ATP-binding protein
MIELQGVTKAYNGETVLDGINLRVGQAESLVILGGSGSGKSTLLRLICGLDRCDAGRILIDGQDITYLSENELIPVRLKMGVLFQEGALFDSLTVKENVAYRLYDEGGWDEAEIGELVERLLGFVGLAHTMNYMPSELSGGMRRRVAIARAMAGRPRILLYDEPTAGLDPVTGRTICDLMVKLRDLEGITSVVVTHDLNAAWFLASYSAQVHDGGRITLEREGPDFCYVHTRFSMLRNGRIIFNGSLPEVMECENPAVQEFIS